MSIWQEVLHSLSVDTRQVFYLNLQALAPVIFALGGSEAVTETSLAVQDVGHWWP